MGNFKLNEKDDDTPGVLETAGFFAGCLGGGGMALIFGPIGVIFLVVLLIRSC